MKPGIYIQRCGGFVLRVVVELLDGELYVTPPSGWKHPLRSYGPEYRFEPA